MRRDIRRNDRSSHANIARCGILAIGLGSLAAYQLMLFFNVTAYVASLSGPESALDRSYLIQGLALFASYLLAARFPEQTRRLTQRQSSKLLAALLLAAATIALSFAGMSETTAIVLFPLGGIVAGVASAALFLAYSQAFCMLSLRQNLITSTLAFGLTSIFFALFSPLLKEPALAFAVSMIAVSGVCLAAVKPFFKEGKLAEPVQRSKDPDSAQGLLVRFILLITVWGTINEFLRTFYVQLGMNEAGNTLFSQMQAIGTVLVVFVSMAIVLFLIVLPKSFNLSLAYRAILLLSLAGILLLPLVSMDVSRTVPYALTTGSSLLLSMTVWVLSVVFATMGNGHPVKVVARIRAFWAIGPYCGFFLARFLFPLVSNSLEILVEITLALSCLLVLSYLSLFTEQNVDELSRLFPSKRKERFNLKCAEVAREHSLSDRELEVMKLLAKGRNASYIQETLFISYNTATTHRKHIYQKLGIHSQQELLDMLDTHQKEKSHHR